MAFVDDFKSFSDSLNPTNRQGTQASLNQLPDQFLGNALNTIILPLAGIAAVIAIIYGGYLYITSGGDPEKAQKAKRVIMYSVIAIVVITLSFIIYNTVMNCVDPSLGGSFICPNR